MGGGCSVSTGEKRMYKKDHQWYTYEECIAYYGKARGEIEWRINHWTQSQVDKWENNIEEESSDSEPNYDYGGYDPNDSS
jgi:hypothetical protein